MIGKSAWNALNFTGHDIYSSDQNLCLCMNKLVYYNLVIMVQECDYVFCLFCIYYSGSGNRSLLQATISIKNLLPGKFFKENLLDWGIQKKMI